MAHQSNAVTRTQNIQRIVRPTDQPFRLTVRIDRYALVVYLWSFSVTKVGITLPNIITCIVKPINTETNDTIREVIANLVSLTQ